MDAEGVVGLPPGGMAMNSISIFATRARSVALSGVGSAVMGLGTAGGVGTL